MNLTLVELRNALAKANETIAKLRLDLDKAMLENEGMRDILYDARNAIKPLADVLRE